MYIEKREKYNLLCKKKSGKKITVSFQWKLEKDTIQKLIEKEYILQIEQKSYFDFAKQIFDTNHLQGIVKKNIIFDTITSSCIKQNSAEKILLSYYQNFYKEFIFQSNQTEWSRIPREEVEKILTQKKTLYKNYNEILEVENSYQARKFLEKDFSFTPQHTKKLYHILTKNLLQENGSSYPKWFKKISNVVGNSYTSSPENVEKDMQQLFERYKKMKKKLFPLQLAFDFHLRYEQIHPFLNGNGRTGRLLMNKILINNNFLPFLVYAENREKYFNAIASVEKTWRKKKYYAFMLEQYQKTLKKYYML